MNIRSLLLGGLLLLTACGSGVVKPGQGNLTATATTPLGQFEFECDPATQNGTPVIIAEQMDFSCPSTDGKANLTILLDTITTTVNAGKPDAQTKTTDTISAVLLVFGPPSVTYGGPAQPSRFARLLNRDYSGTFTATLPGKVSLGGSFNFHAE